MALSIQPDNLVSARFGGPLNLSEETQTGLMVVIIAALVVFLWQTWR